jgi:DNA invertase Pin-like site-specific DNA recombinase
MDFAKLVEVFDRNNVTFVSVTQSFNTTTSMGRLTLNILLSFAQFEREVIGERIRDKFAASRRKGMWMGCQSACWAFRWRDILENGTNATIAEIAAAEKINESYVSRVLRLTLLAPDVIEAILGGRQGRRRHSRY